VPSQNIPKTGKTLKKPGKTSQPLIDGAQTDRSLTQKRLNNLRANNVFTTRALTERTEQQPGTHTPTALGGKADWVWRGLPGTDYRYTFRTTRKLWKI